MLMYQLNNKKVMVMMLIIIIILCTFVVTSNAATTITVLTPADNQYLELRAVTVKNVNGQNKQVIMELWGYNLDFKRI